MRSEQFLYPRHNHLSYKANWNAHTTCNEIHLCATCDMQHTRSMQRTATCRILHMRHGYNQRATYMQHTCNNTQHAGQHIMQKVPLAPPSEHQCFPSFALANASASSDFSKYELQLACNISLHTTCMQHTCIIHVTCNILRSTHDMQHATCNTQRNVTCDIQHATKCNMRRTLRNEM